GRRDDAVGGGEHPALERPLDSLAKGPGPWMDSFLDTRVAKVGNPRQTGPSLETPRDQVGRRDRTRRVDGPDPFPSDDRETARQAERKPRDESIRDGEQRGIAAPNREVPRGV